MIASGDSLCLKQKKYFSMNHCQFHCYGLLKIYLKRLSILMTTSLARFVFYENDRVLVTQNENLMDWVPKKYIDAFLVMFKITDFISDLQQNARNFSFCKTTSSRLRLLNKISFHCLTFVRFTLNIDLNSMMIMKTKRNFTNIWSSGLW